MTAIPTKLRTILALLAVTLLTTAAHAQVSDDFAQPTLDPAWTFEDPLGGSTNALADGQLTLSVAGGKEHNLWSSGNHSVRVTQPVADGDFEFEAKFESIPTLQFQMQGILVETSPGNYQRADFYGNGDGIVRLFVASFVDDAPKTRANLTLPAVGSALWMRVRRVANTWTYSYSLDGIAWTTAISYDDAVTVTRAGVYGGNAGAAPAFDAVVDYFFETGSPVVPEDGALDTDAPVISALTVTPQQNDATIGWTTDEDATARVLFGETPGLELGDVARATYRTDHALVLDALTAQTTYYFQVESADAIGNLATSALDSFTTTGNAPPVVALTGPVDGARVDSGATVDLTADATDADGSVTQVEFLVDGFVVDTDLAAPWTTTWSSPTPGDFVITARATDDGGAVTASAAATLEVRDPVPPAIVSDDFSAPALDTGLWTFVDPQGGSSYAMDAGRLQLSVVGGIEHNLWTAGNQSVRVMQDVPDTDFEYEVKFESTPTQQFQIQGILFEEAPGDYVRLDYFSIGGGSLSVFSSSFVNDSPTPYANVTVEDGDGALWLRMQRTGDDWVASASPDGVNWTVVSSFTHAMTVNSLGVYGGNAGAQAPAFDVFVDYAFNTAAPIVPEDGGMVDTTPPVIAALQVAPDANRATLTWTTDELATSRIDYGRTPNLELGFLAPSGYRDEHDLEITGLATSTTYYFRVSGADAAGNASSLPTATFTTLAAPNLPPSVTLTAPIDGQRFVTGAPIPLSADAVDPDGSIAQVSFLVDGVVVVVDSTAPYDTTWAAPVAGDYVVTARATDDRGERATSAAAAIEVRDPVTTAILSDDFSQTTLDTGLWTFVDPRGGSNFALEAGRLHLAIHDQAEHNLWFGGNNSVRVVQPAPDTDFEVEVKFESTPTVASQIQGILVEESSGNYIRLDYYSDGTDLLVFAASVVGNTPTTRVNTPVPVGSGALWLRMNRTGDQWTGSASTDGLNWQQITSFTHDMTVSAVGLYGGNAGAPIPAFDVYADYFFETADPIENEDGAPIDVTPPVISNVVVAENANDALATFTTNELALGRVAYGETPALEIGTVSGPLYVTGHAITLPSLNVSTQYYYQLIAEDGRGNVAQSAIDSFTTLAQPNTPPSVALITPVDGARILEGNDVALEATASDAEGSVVRVEFLVDDVVVATDTTAPYQAVWTPPAVGNYVVRARATDDMDAVTTTAAANIEIRVPVIADITSDDFSAATLDTSLWTFVDPRGGSSYSIDANRLRISVNDATDHNPWTSGNNSVRIVQATSDGDFEIEAKFETTPSIPNQLQGLIAQQTEDRYIRLDYYADNSGTVSLFAAALNNGTPTQFGNAVVPTGGGDLWLRLSRVADTWTASTSIDGANWVQRFTFDYGMTVTGVGVYGGNAGVPIPAYDVLVDYFFDTSNPIEGEDGAPVDVTPPVIANALVAPNAFDAVVTFTTDELARGSVAYGLTDSLELGVIGSSEYRTDHAVTLPGLTITTDYYYQIVAEDVRGNVAQDSIATFTTLDTPNEPPTVALTAPLDGDREEIGEPVTLEATASDNDGSVVEVDFLVDGLVVATDTTAPYSATWVADALGNRSIAARARDDDGGTTTSTPISFEVTPPVGPIVLDSDDFNTDRLDPATWNFTSPLGNGQAFTADGNLVIEVPGGQAHDLWAGINSIVSVRQAAPDADMTVESRFVSIPSITLQLQGLIVESTPSRHTRFDVQRDGSGNLRAFAATIDGASTTTHGSVVVPETGFDAIELRLARTGSNWVASYSVNGTDWTQVASFSWASSVVAVGIFGGNTGLAPAFDVVADYFVEASDPLPNEDTGPRVTLTTPPSVVPTSGATDLVAEFVGTAAERSAQTTMEIFVDDQLLASDTTDSLGAAWSPAAGTYRVTGRALDAFGVTTTSAPRTIAVHDPADTPSSFSSDFREAALDPAVWNFVDPTAASTTGTASGALQVTAPVGADVATDPTNAPRWSQVLASTTLDLELALDTLPVEAGASAGLLFTNGSGDALRVAVTGAGRITGDLFTGGGSSSLFDTALGAGEGRVVRVAADAGLWTVQASDASGTLFSDVLTAAPVAPAFDTVALFAATDGTTAGDFTAAFDWFFDRTVPVAVEDAVVDVDLVAPVVSALNATDDALAGAIDVSFDTDEAATVLVEYGLDETFGTQVSSVVPATTHAFTLGGFTDDDNVFFRILVTDGAGNVRAVRTMARRVDDGSGPLVDVWYGTDQRTGHLGRVQNDFNVLGKVTPVARLTELTYRLNGGVEIPLSVGGRIDGFGDGRRLGRTGDFNADISIDDLQVGLNTVTLRAADADGNTTLIDVSVTREATGSTPTPTTITWDTVTDITDVGQPVDGLWQKTPDGLRVGETGYDRLFLVGETTWQDYEALVPVTIHAIDSTTGPNSGIPAVGMITRFAGHATSGFGADPNAQPKWGFLPLGGIGWLRFVGLTQPDISFYRGDETNSYPFGSFPISLGGTYMMRMRCETLPDSPEGFGVTRYSYRVWEQGSSEPSAWDFQFEQTSEFALREGALALVAHHVDATYGDVQITQLASEPPVVVAGDVNRDLEITQDDAAQILGHVVGRSRLDDDVRRAADLGGIVGIDAHDAALVSYLAAGGEVSALATLGRAATPALDWGKATADDTALTLPLEVPGGAALRSWTVELRGDGLGTRVREVAHDLEADAQMAWHVDGDVLRIAFAAPAPVEIEATLVRVVLETGDRFERPMIEATARLDGGEEMALGSQVLTVVPRVFSLAENYPNPFNPQTRIEFGLPASARVRLDVYDVRGRRVATLVDGTLDGGHHRVVWDGTDASGRRVASGVYLYRLDAPGFSSQKKMLLVK